MEVILTVATPTVQALMIGPNGRRQLLWAYIGRAWRPEAWTQRDGHGTSDRKVWNEGEWEALTAALAGIIKRPDLVR